MLLDPQTLLDKLSLLLTSTIQQIITTKFGLIIILFIILEKSASLFLNLKSGRGKRL